MLSFIRQSRSRSSSSSAKLIWFPRFPLCAASICFPWLISGQALCAWPLSRGQNAIRLTVFSLGSKLVHSCLLWSSWRAPLNVRPSSVGDLQYWSAGFIKFKEIAFELSIYLKNTWRRVVCYFFYFFTQIFLKIAFVQVKYWYIEIILLSKAP